MDELNLFTPATHFIGLELAAKLTLKNFDPLVQQLPVKDISDLFLSTVTNVCHTAKKNIEQYLNWETFRPGDQNIIVNMALNDGGLEFSEDHFVSPDPTQTEDPYLRALDNLLNPTRTAGRGLQQLTTGDEGASSADNQSQSFYQWFYSLFTQRGAAGDLQVNQTAVNDAQEHITRIGYSNYLFVRAREYAENMRSREGALGYALSFVDRIWDQKVPAASSALSAGIFATLFTVGPTGAVAAGLMAGAGKIFEKTCGEYLWENTVVGLRAALSNIWKSSIQSVEQSVAGQIWLKFLGPDLGEDRNLEFKEFIDGLRAEIPHEEAMHFNGLAIEASNHLVLEIFVMELIDVVSKDFRVREVAVEFLKLLATKGALSDGETILSPIGVARIIGYIEGSIYSIRQYDMLVLLLKNVDKAFKASVIAYLIKPAVIDCNPSGQSINPIADIIRLINSKKPLSQNQIAQLALIFPFLEQEQKESLNQENLKIFLKGVFSSLHDITLYNESLNEGVLYSLLSLSNEVDHELFKECLTCWLEYIRSNSKDKEYNKRVVKELLETSIVDLRKILFDFYKSIFSLTLGEYTEFSDAFLQDLLNILEQ